MNSVRGFFDKSIFSISILGSWANLLGFLLSLGKVSVLIIWKIIESKGGWEFVEYEDKKLLLFLVY